MQSHSLKLQWSKESLQTNELILVVSDEIPDHLNI